MSRFIELSNSLRSVVNADLIEVVENVCFGNEYQLNFIIGGEEISLSYSYRQDRDNDYEAITGITPCYNNF